MRPDEIFNNLKQGKASVEDFSQYVRENPMKVTFTGVINSIRGWFDHVLQMQIINAFIDIRPISDAGFEALITEASFRKGLYFLEIVVEKTRFSEKTEAAFVYQCLVKEWDDLLNDYYKKYNFHNATFDFMLQIEKFKQTLNNAVKQGRPLKWLQKILCS